MIPAGRWRVKRCSECQRFGWTAYWAIGPKRSADTHLRSWAEAMAYVDAVVTRARREQS